MDAIFNTTQKILIEDIADPKILHLGQIRLTQVGTPNFSLSDFVVRRCIFQS